MAQCSINLTLDDWSDDDEREFIEQRKRSRFSMFKERSERDLAEDKAEREFWESAWNNIED